MPANCDPPYGIQDYTITAGQVATPEFSYASIPLLDNALVAHSAQLEVFLEGDALTPTTDYTVDPGTQKITVSATIAEGEFLRIRRDTYKCDRYVDYQNNAQLDEADLDLDSDQIFYIALEAYDLAWESIGLSNSGDCWDAQGKKICNLAPGTNGTDGVTLDQVRNIILGGETATIADTKFWSFVATASQTDFPLADADVPPTVDAAMFYITVDNVLQNPDAIGGSYTVGDDGSGKAQIEFGTGLAENSVVTVRLTTGTFFATLVPGGVETDDIADDAVTLAKLGGFGAGSAGRFIVVDATGNVPACRTIVHGDITDFDIGVQQNSLDKMAAPVSSVSMGSNQIKNLSAGTLSTDAATKGQVDTAQAAAQSYADSILTTNANVIQGVANAASTTQTHFTLNFPFDGLAIWPIASDVASSGHLNTPTTITKSSAAYTYQTRDSFQLDGLDYATPGEASLLVFTGVPVVGNITLGIERTSTGFYYRRIGGASGNIAFKFTAVKNGSI